MLGETAQYAGIRRSVEASEIISLGPHRTAVRTSELKVIGFGPPYRWENLSNCEDPWWPQ